MGNRLQLNSIDMTHDFLRWLSSTRLNILASP